MTAEPTNQADDFPPRSWLLVEVKPAEVPAAVRMRAWLKDGLRRHGIKAVRLTGEVPKVEATGPENANPGPSRAPGLTIRTSQVTERDDHKERE